MSVTILVSTKQKKGEMMRRLYLIVFSLFAFANSYAAGASCVGRFVNPLTDICWPCLFPMTLGAAPVVPNAEGVPDTINPATPVAVCPAPAPEFVRVGLTIGYWEPFALTDITRIPYCMVNMGTQMSMGVNQQAIGGKTSENSGAMQDGSFYWVHWYKYPVIYWLQIIEGLMCQQVGGFDLAWISELDPTYNDDMLSFILNPEAILFGNPVTQLACVADAIKTSTNFALPIDVLFWCAGSQGSMYPLDGYVQHTYSNVSNAILVDEKMNFKLHREGVILESRGEYPAICYEWPEPILPKSRYRYQFTNVVPESYICHPYGTTSVLSEAGKDNPVTGVNFGILNWRKRNCVFG